MTLIARESGQEYYGDWVKVTLSSPRQTVLVFAGLDWHYGPNEGGDQDPGKMWHTDYDGEVHVIDGVHICDCGQDDHSRALVLAERIASLDNEPPREGETMSTAVPSAPEEPRIAGVWVAPEINSIFVKHANGATVQIKCAEAGLLAEAADGEIHGWQQVWVPKSTKEE